MKKKSIIQNGLLVIAIMASPSVLAQDLVMHPISKDGKTYTPIRWNDISQVKALENDTMNIELKEGNDISLNRIIKRRLNH